jgi:3',5'-cyclic AMP phosphodiesterase CpdA
MPKFQEVDKMKNHKYLSQGINYMYRVLILSLLCFSIGFAQSSVDTLKILHISDTHLCNLDNYQPKFIHARKHYGNGVKPLKTFFNTIPKKQEADAVIITGDIIDFYEAKTPDGEFLATQIEQFYPLFNLCPIPLYMTLGNHDINSYWIAEADTTKRYAQYQLNANKARATWIRNIPCFQNGTYYSRDFRVGTMKYRFIFLDNGYSLRDSARRIDKTQLDWLIHKIKDAGNQPIVLFMHVYLPVGDKNGDGTYFKPNDPDWPDAESCSQGLLKVLNENTTIKAIFVGHGHKNVIEQIDFPSGHNIVQCETGGFSSDPNNWRIIKFTETNIMISRPGNGQLAMGVDFDSK